MAGIGVTTTWLLLLWSYSFASVLAQTLAKMENKVDEIGRKEQSQQFQAPQKKTKTQGMQLKSDGRLGALARILFAYSPASKLDQRTISKLVVRSTRAPTKAPIMKTGAELEQMGEDLRLARDLRGEWKLKEAVDQATFVIDDVPIEIIKNVNAKSAIYLKYALLLRAEWNLLMGNIDKSLEDFRTIISHLPTDRDAKLSMAHALQDARGDTSQAYSIMEKEVLREGPGGQTLDAGSFCWSAQDAGVFAAALGNHAAAQKHFQTFQCLLADCQAPVAEKIKRQAQGFFYEMVNSFCNGDSASAARAAQRLSNMRMQLPELEMRRDVLNSSWDYIVSTPLSIEPGRSLFFSTHQMLQLGMDAVSLNSGLILEFGVWHGASLRMIASQWPEEEAHGFDTFTGLPEQWGLIENGGEPVGAYSTFSAMPSGLPENVKLYEGLFKDTLPAFLEAHPGPIRFMNIDCDLYSSTKDILDNVFDRIVPGTIIVFDEYLATPTWQDDEFKAFKEAVMKHGWTYEYLAISLMSGQAVVRIT